MNAKLDKYFAKYLKEYAFLELMPDYVKKEHLDFLRNVPIPIKKEKMEDLAHDDGIEFTNFTLGMINIMGINPSFEYAPQYINFLTYVNDDIVNAIVLVGIDQAKEGELDRACISLRAALAIDSEDQDALYNYMLVCRNLYTESDDKEYISDFKGEVFETLIKLEGLNPNLDMVHYYLGFAYLNAGKYIDAKKEWDTFLELSESSEEREEVQNYLNKLVDPVKIEKGYLDIMAGRYDEGLKVLEKFIDTKNMGWWPLPYYLGVAYNRTGRFSEAVGMLNKAFNFNPSSGEIIAELLMSHRALGDEVNSEKYRQKLEILRNRNNEEE